MCEAISVHAFDVSELPVVLSLEVHCDVPQQDRMVEVLSLHPKVIVDS